MDRIVVIGLGSIGNRHLSNIKKLYPAAKTLAVSSSGILPNELNANIDEYSLKLEDAIQFSPQFAIVASPATFHAKHAIQLIQAKIPVLIEKPLVSTSEEATQLLDVIEKARLPATVGHCLRYMPALQVVKTVLKEGLLGIIYNVTAHVGQYLPHWRPNKNYQSSVSASPQLGGGALLELSHEFDYIQYLFGRLTFKHAVLRNTNDLNLAVEEIADVVFRTEAGAICNVHLDFYQKTPQRYCYIVGEEGQLRWDLLRNEVTLFLLNEKKCIYSDPLWDKNNMYLTMIERFVEDIKNSNSDHQMLRDAQETVLLIEKIKTYAEIWENP